MDSFLALPRFAFTRAAIEYAPEEPGIYGLFDGTELIYIGRAERPSIKAWLLLHQDGAQGECTMRATAYTWEITLWPRAREAEILSRFYQANRRDPRCQHKAA
jgi:hypothetical protein